MSGILPSSANQCILGKVRLIRSTKDTVSSQTTCVGLRNAAKCTLEAVVTAIDSRIAENSRVLSQ